MKTLKYLPIIWVFVVCAIAFSAGLVQLSELYKTGKVRFDQDLVLDDDRMPEDVFFESPSTIRIYMNQQKSQKKIKKTISIA